MIKQRRSAYKSESTGFTLIELMIVLALIAIVSTLAVPSVTSLVANQRVSSAASDLMLGLLQARGEAVKRNDRVVVLPLSGSDWATGWQAFVDTNGNSAFDTGEVVIFTAPALATGISQNASVSGLTAATLYRYNGTGFLGAGGNASVSFTSSSGSRTRHVIVSQSGRPRVCDVAASSTCLSGT